MLLSSLFGADKISFDDLGFLEKSAPEIIVWAAPIMFFFAILEYYFSKKHGHDHYEKDETIGSVLVGIGNVVISFLIKAALLMIVVVIYNWVPWRMHLQWWTFIPAYIIWDFCSYWAHRISHSQRFWWATHIVHHSGEKYNLTVSFRLSWIQHLKIIFFVPAMFFGFHPIIIFVTNQIAVLFQFWVHTEYIRKLHPVIEYIFATPSNHRVHHGSQEQYIDRNFGATFIIWDRMFGTYEPEREQVTYGLTTNIDNKANPIHINFPEIKEMIKDAKEANGWRNKLYAIFGSPIKIAEVKKRLAEVKYKKTQSAPLRVNEWQLQEVGLCKSIPILSKPNPN
jgi:sterol desaturase/sphingolipid hydroxylase (fatty acid hydroxylase superfamily)